MADVTKIYPNSGAAEGRLGTAVWLVPLSQHGGFGSIELSLFQLSNLNSTCDLPLDQYITKEFF